MSCLVKARNVILIGTDTLRMEGRIMDYKLMEKQESNNEHESEESD